MIGHISWQTYNTDKQVTDSAASSTAYVTGVKTNQENIGVDVNVLNQDCDAMNNPEFHTKSILRDFQVNYIFFPVEHVFSDCLLSINLHQINLSWVRKPHLLMTHLGERTLLS